jgi:hypothetical protein
MKKTYLTPRRGDLREDGMIFWSFSNKDYEWWVTKSHYDDLTLKQDIALIKYRTTRASHIRNLARINAKSPTSRARNTRLQAVRRARKADCPISDELETKFLYELCQAISRGSGVPHHVDHIIPLFLGGAHTTSNLRIIPATANLSKGACIDGISYVDKNKTSAKRGGGY